MFLTALIGTLILMALIVIPQFFAGGDPRRVSAWVILGFVVNLVFLWLFVYMALPPLTGPLGGWQLLWLPMLLNACIAGSLAAFSSEAGEDEESRAHAAAAAGLAIGLVVMTILVVTVMVNGAVAKDRGKLAFANVQPALPVTQTLADGSVVTSAEGIVVTVNVSVPATDEEHLPIVTDGNATNRAAGSLTGTIGSRYVWGKPVLQSVNEHLYRVSLMQFKNFWMIFQSDSTPGYIMIDAENPLVEDYMLQEYPIKYFTGAFFGNDVRRYLYNNGFSNYVLVDPTIEISDDYKVYETIGLGRYVYGWGGLDIVGMAIVDVATGEITTCRLGECPDWIDRVLPDDVTNTYIKWFGLYQYEDWWNPGVVNTLMDADDTAAMIYNSDGHTAWQYLMTSTNMSDNSGVGLVLYDSHQRSGTYYTFDYPFPVGSQVRSMFENNRVMNQSKAVVDQLILVYIFDEYTWVATMVTPGNTGTVYQYTAVLRASKSSVSDDVQYDKDPKIAMRNYEMWLASHQDQSEVDPTQQASMIVVEGIVTAVGTTVVQGTTYHVFTLNDMAGSAVTYVDSNGETRVRYFVGVYNPMQTIELPLLAVGHHVMVTYLDTEMADEVQIVVIDDLDVP